jgi:hypothetical protein
MAQHRVEVHQPSRVVLNSDVTFDVWAGDEKLGELRVSKGSVDWRGGKRKKTVRKTWEQFARLMEG